ncbi:hypothetical protein L3V79_04630 [Thiotrichales bacterium 19S9-12]|nr:hypothetical protein [Thiotrichales bacterium 19S9-11]MCF6811644.1 hypothetical protein [Thiotrichales bacterium 19S9-12]
MIHEYFIEQLAQDKIDDETYEEQIQKTVKLLDQWVRAKFSEFDIQPDGSNLSEIERNIAQFSDRILMIVLFDVLKQQNIESAAKVFNFWLKVAIEGGKNKHNLHLESVIITGLNQFYLKVFAPVRNKETGEYRIGYALLDELMKEKWQSLRSFKDNYPLSLIKETKNLPPLNLYATPIFKAKEVDDKKAYNEALKFMIFFQSQKFKSLNLTSAQNIEAEVFDRQEIVKFSSLLILLNASAITVNGTKVEYPIDPDSDLDKFLIKQSKIMATPLSSIDSKTELDLKQEQKSKKLKKRLSTKSLPVFKKHEDYASGSKTERGYTKKKKTVDIHKVQSESVSGIQNDKLTDKDNQSDQIIRFAPLGLSKEESTPSFPRSIPDSLFFSESLSFKEALSLSPMIEKIT